MRTARSMFGFTVHRRRFGHLCIMDFMTGDSELKLNIFGDSGSEKLSRTARNFSAWTTTKLREQKFEAYD